MIWNRAVLVIVLPVCLVAANIGQCSHATLSLQLVTLTDSSTRSSGRSGPHWTGARENQCQRTLQYEHAEVLYNPHVLDQRHVRR